MADGTQGDQNIHAENNSIAFGGISVGGNVGDIRIGHTIGFTSEQVSTLITQISTTFQAKPFDGRSPYKGLDFFEEEDAELFFGREKLVGDLVSRVKDSCTVFITGPSGSGKSSLVRAGLIHALKQGALPSSDRWLYATIKPGREPIQTLARAVAGLVMSTNAEDEIRAKALADESIFARWCEIALRDGRDKRVVLFIDQFEEVFTQISKEEERIAFLNLLTHAAAVENGRVSILFSMRSDFVPNCATYPKLNALLNQQFVQIGAMQGDELVSAIAQPALRVGLRIDPDLIAQIINDMQGEPGALPLMQFALKDLFDAQQAKGGLIALTLKDYLERGGIRKALERHADQTFAAFSTEEQDLARSIFTGLIEIGRGTQDTRRTAIFDELVPANAQSTSVEAIVVKLADARLITTDEIGGKDTVTISHEKLIDAWPWLKKLVNENREVIALQNEIAEDAKEWDENRRDPSYLYSGARLVNANEQLKSNKLVLSGTALEYIRAGQARQRVSRLSLISALSGIIVLLVLAVIVFSTQSSENKRLAVSAQAANAQAVTAAADAQAQAKIAKEQAQVAQEKTKLARNGELSAEAVALRNKRFQLSLLLAVEAYKDPISNQSYEALLENVQSHSQLRTYLNGHIDDVTSIAISPDGKILASGSKDTTIILWNVTTGIPIGQPLEGHLDGISSVAFSPDGKTLASGSKDTTIILWNVTTGIPIGQPLEGHLNGISSVAFSPDGKTLASGSRDRTVILWDLETGIPMPLAGHIDYVLSIAFSPDGKTLASGSKDTTIILWNVTTGELIEQLLSGHTDYVTSVAFSPDGKTLASGSRDRTVILWDVETRQPIGQPLKGHVDDVSSVDFSPDGKILASGSRDRTIVLWDVETREPLGQPLKGHIDSIFSYVTSIAFSPDGKTLASGSRDRTVILWDAIMSSPLSRPLKEHVDGISNLTFRSDGKTLAAGNNSGKIILWDVAEGRSSGQSLIENASSLTFSPDSKSLAYGNHDGTIILWDVVAGRPIGQPLEGDATTLSFSPDGKIVAFGTHDGNTIVWDVGEGRRIGQPLPGAATTLSFSPNGRMLAIVNGITTIKLLNMTTGNIDQSLEGHTQVVNAVAFSSKGETLASGSNDTTIILWDVKTGKRKGQPLEGHTEAVTSIAFSPDGKILASGSRDRTIILWNVETGTPIGQPLEGHLDGISSVTFSPNSKTLASASADTTIILWDLDPQSWIEKSCRRANRNFTHSEWEQYFPAQKDNYQKTCKQFQLEPRATNTTPIVTVTPAIISSLPVIRPSSYMMQKGDNFDCIARRYNVNPKEFFALNGVVDDWIYGELVYADIVVAIPQTGNPYPGTRAFRNHPTTYIVTSANETLGSVACAFGDLDPVSIAAANGLSASAVLIPGQQLMIP